MCSRITVPFHTHCHTPIFHLHIHRIVCILAFPSMACIFLQSNGMWSPPHKDFWNDPTNTSFKIGNIHQLGWLVCPLLHGHHLTLNSKLLLKRTVGPYYQSKNFLSRQLINPIQLYQCTTLCHFHPQTATFQQRLGACRPGQLTPRSYLGLVS